MEYGGNGDRHFFIFQCKEFLMKKNNLLLGIPVIMLVFTMTAVGCVINSMDDNNNGDNITVLKAGITTRSSL